MLLTQIGVHDKEVKVLLQVAAMLRDLSSEQVQHCSQQVVTKAQIITALIHKHDKQQRINEATIQDENHSTYLVGAPFHIPRCNTDLSRGSRRGSGGGARTVLQGEVSDEDYELGKRSTDLSTWALEEILREAIRVSEQNVVCKPVAYILTVSQQDAERVIPREETPF